VSDVNKYLSGRHAIVTGGGRGIGAAIADELATLSATLTLMGRDSVTLNKCAERITSTFAIACSAMICDVGDEQSVAKAFARARESHGEAHILVNNAGQAEAARFVETKRELWDRMIAVNLTGTFLCTQQALPAMLKSGEGRIINIASTAGLKGYPTIAAYCASKHGVIGLTRALAAETAKAKVTVNAVCPGYTDTDMSTAGIKNLMAAGKSEQEARELIVRTIPRGSLITPQEVANAVAWLCSPGASAITGQAIVVAAGEVMK
jgi:NAD(P)-dependent dehydrogenase (short-subunit alcohol dehydrogenase family)